MLILTIWHLLLQFHFVWMKWNGVVIQSYYKTRLPFVILSIGLFFEFHIEFPLWGSMKDYLFFFKVTPVVPLSNDSWSMSFAKYLELRFYGHQYTRRANAEPCGHSIHKDYHQYFLYNQMVASFRLVSCFCVDCSFTTELHKWHI